MTMDVASKVIDILSNYCEDMDLGVVVDTSTPLQQLELDSLALMELMFELEEALGITLGLDELNGNTTVGDLVTAINRARRNGAFQTM
mgnify:CR=1 FL=1